MEEPGGAATMEDGSSELLALDGRVNGAFEALCETHELLSALTRLRTTRSWTLGEYDRYLRYALAEQLALRDYIDARRAFDLTRRNIRTVRR